MRLERSAFLLFACFFLQSPLIAAKRCTTPLSKVALLLTEEVPSLTHLLNDLNGAGLSVPEMKAQFLNYSINDQKLKNFLAREVQDLIFENPHLLPFHRELSELGRFKERMAEDVMEAPPFGTSRPLIKEGGFPIGKLDIQYFPKSYNPAHDTPDTFKVVLTLKYPFYLLNGGEKGFTNRMERTLQQHIERRLNIQEKDKSKHTRALWLPVDSKKALKEGHQFIISDIPANQDGVQYLESLPSVIDSLDTWVLRQIP